MLRHASPASGRRTYAGTIVLVLLLSLLVASCQPVQAPPVAPEVDRVGFPTGYQENYTVFYEFDRPDNKSARVIYANDAAAGVSEDGIYAYGSILVMDVYRTQQDEAGNVLLDENGRYLRGDLNGLFVMRKEAGFGAKYGDFQSGEWEYVAYRPDATVMIAPENTSNCARCHMEASMGKDWVFGTHRHFEMMAPSEPIELPENTVNVDNYLFTPNVITVTVGTEVTWVNNDDFIHTVTADDLAFGSGALRVQADFRHTFEAAGEFNYFCAIHPSMRGTVVVTE